MGFAAGFMNQWNIIEDRKQKREMLNQQISAKRQETLVDLMAARQKRTQVSTDESGALMAIQERLKDADGQPLPGSQEYLETVGKAGAASSIMQTILDREAKVDDNNLSIRGTTLMEAFTPYYQDGQPQINLPSLDDIYESDLSDTEEYLEMKSRIGLPQKPAEPFVDVDTKTLFAANKANRDEAKEEFDRLLLERFSAVSDSDPTKANVQLTEDLNALAGTNVTLRNNARRRLMMSPEGMEVYSEMLEAAGEVPVYGVISSLPGSFNDLREVWGIYNAWERVSPENQNIALQKYPFLEGMLYGRSE